MTRHDWIVSVLEDIAAYAKRNDLPRAAQGLRAAARRVNRLPDPRQAPAPGEPPGNVIHLPMLRVPRPARPQSNTKVCIITSLRN